MNKELIERLRLMSADTIGNDAADALESLEAAYTSAVEAGKALAKQALKAEQERDALAAKLKALRIRDSELFDCDVSPLPLQEKLHDFHMAPSLIGPLAATWADKPHWTVYDLIAAVRHYATRYAPTSELTDETINAMHGHDGDKYAFARAIERYIKGEM